MKSDIEVNQN